MSGPKADEFLSKVQQAATGHPWYSHAKPVVGLTVIQLFNYSIHCYVYRRLYKFLMNMSRFTVTAPQQSANNCYLT